MDVEELEVDFSSPSYEPDGFAYRYYREHPASQASMFAAKLSEQKSIATQQIQRKVYKHYEKFIESSKVVATVQDDLLQLRRSLSQLDTSLQTLQTQAQKLVKFSRELESSPIVSNNFTHASVTNEFEDESRYNRIVVLNEKQLG